MMTYYQFWFPDKTKNHSALFNNDQEAIAYSGNHDRLLRVTHIGDNLALRVVWRLKDRYPLWARVFVGVPTYIALGFVLAFLNLFSTQAVGEAMKDTGDGLVNDKR